MSEKPLNNRSASRTVLLAIVFLIAGRTALSVHAAEPMVPLTGHLAVQLQGATKLATVKPEELVGLSLAVQLDTSLMDQALLALYGPGAPAHKRYLSSAEFAEKFGLAGKRQELKNFAKANGLTVDPALDQAESMVVSVSGRADQVEAAFHVQLNQYRGSDGKIFRAHETEPLIPASLKPHLSAILGLSNVEGLMKTHLKLSPIASASARAMAPSILTNGTGPGGSLAPGDIKTIYGLSPSATSGAGQVVALVEFDGYTPSDITHYETFFNISPILVTPVSVDGTANTAGVNAGEVTLDIEMVAALAPGLSQMLVYEGPNSQQGVYDVYNRIATDNRAAVVTTSWGFPERQAHALAIAESSSLSTSENLVFQRMALQGQTIYAASGDSGAYDDLSTISVDDPASQPYVTGVGGTSISGTAQSPAESSWNSCGAGQCFQSSGGSTGGGVSTIWPIPDYQRLVNTTANGGSSTMRNVPDIALNADPDSSPYGIYLGGAWFFAGGTSAAAPLWAALTAIINQQRTAAGFSSFGFANPTLYELAASTTSATLFKDITLGGDNGFYRPGVGYDNTTGLGSPRGNALISSASLVNPSEAVGSLTGLYAFPNPWRSPQHVGLPVTFTNATRNIPEGTTVKIFTLSGFWVKTLTAANGSAPWDLTNDAGKRVASGLYFYLATSGDSQLQGTIAIIR